MLPDRPAQALPREPALPTRGCPSVQQAPPLLPAPEALGGGGGMADDIPSAVTAPPGPEAHMSALLALGGRQGLSGRAWRPGLVLAPLSWRQGSFQAQVLRAECRPAWRLLPLAWV